nr:hypothetical protein [Anatilimnocola floriformis]
MCQILCQKRGQRWQLLNSRCAVVFFNFRVSIQRQRNARMPRERLSNLRRDASPRQAGNECVAQGMEVQHFARSIDIRKAGGVQIGPEHCCGVVRPASWPEKPFATGKPSPQDRDKIAAQGLAIILPPFAVGGLNRHRCRFKIEGFRQQAFEFGCSQAGANRDEIEHHPIFAGQAAINRRGESGFNQLGEVVRAARPALAGFIGFGIQWREMRHRVYFGAAVSHQPGHERLEVASVIVARLDSEGLVKRF